MKLYSETPKKALAAIAAKRVSVGMVGFGYIGSSIGSMLAAKGIRTIAIDVNQKLIDEVNGGTISVPEPGLKELVKKAVAAGKLTATKEFGSLRDVDIIIVTVGTPLSKTYSPDMSHIEAAAKAIAKNLRKGHLVILKSTLPPGTTEGIVKTILETSKLKAGKDFGLAFSPERLSEGSAVKELLSLPIVIGGYDEKSAALTATFWETVLKVETVVVADAKTAEMVKLADNAWIDLNIALGNEIALLCDQLGIDAPEVIHAANTLPKLDHNVNILMPSMGVGGYCLTKDPWFLHSIARSRGIELRLPVASRTINDAMPRYTFEVIKKTLEEQGKKIRGAKVAVLGLAFKSNTGDCRFTPTKYTIELLEKSGCKLSLFDPLVSREDAESISDLPMSKSIETAITGADCIAFFTGHREFKQFPLATLKKLAAKKCSIVDGRNMWSREEVATIKKLGFIYRGIGRT